MDTHFAIIISVNDSQPASQPAIGQNSTEATWNKRYRYTSSNRRENNDSPALIINFGRGRDVVLICIVAVQKVAEQTRVDQLIN